MSSLVKTTIQSETGHRTLKDKAEKTRENQ